MTASKGKLATSPPGQAASGHLQSSHAALVHAHAKAATVRTTTVQPSVPHTSFVQEVQNAAYNWSPVEIGRAHV